MPAVPIKSSPFDIHTFRNETSVKYPTFTPPAQPKAHDAPEPASAAPTPISPLKLALAFSPIPVRHHYHHGDGDGDFQSASGLPPSSTMGAVGLSQGHAHGQGPHGYQLPTYNTMATQQPLTPMPSPPPSPKPKKQQYQTDQNRPFLFPFARTPGAYARRDARLVPFAIDEADRLYSRHMHVSVALVQMWRTREACQIEESGLQRMPGSGAERAGGDTLESVLSLNGGAGVGVADRRGSVADTIYRDVDDPADELPDVALLNAKIAEAEAAIKQARGGGGDRSEGRRIKEARERREDLLRLKRVEQIYVRASD